ncbi:hypothetical protein [Natronomonas sp. EA1]|uniref:hypothetical protein n=1 Tax=Natronomonas sp. EA1 TaxID=3421655 RepID=UPI003EBCBCD1
MTEDAYSGLFGAFPYAFRRSDSRLFRGYVLLGGLVALLLALVFVFALITTVANTLGTGGGTFTFARAFVIVVALLVLFPVIAPVLLVARRHRRAGSDTRYDAALAGMGLLFLLSLYLGLVASVPPEFVLDGEPVTRPAPSGLFAPLIRVLYAVPTAGAAGIPALVALAMYGVHRALDR